MFVNFRHPSELNEDFGDETVELVDTKTNQSLGEHTLKKFWDGYSNISKRVKDSMGNPAIAKVSGWPGTFGDEFKETMPDRSSDFLRQLPILCYTGRAAPLNLAASLPETFARAEVGPRASITYGNLGVSHRGCGVYFERADSINVLMHAQIPRDLSPDDFRAKALRVMETLGCDNVLVQKCKEDKGYPLPAAIWTIFHPADSDKIRDLLNKEAADRGDKYVRELNFDPFLEEHGAKIDDSLIKRLKDEYNVKPFIVAQLPGEAVFIPAGAPRQVSCIENFILIGSKLPCNQRFMG